MKNATDKTMCVNARDRVSRRLRGACGGSYLAEDHVPQRPADRLLRLFQRPASMAPRWAGGGQRSAVVARHAVLR